MEEDPEDLFGDVDDFLAPDAVGARVVDGSDEAGGLGCFGGGGVVEVDEDGAGAGDKEVGGGGGEVGEEEADDYAAGGEFAGAFLFFVEEHGEEGGEEGGLDGGEVVEGEGGGAESFEAKQRLVEEGVFVLLSRRAVSFAFSVIMLAQDVPPLHLHRPIQQPYYLSHTAFGDKGINPCDRLVSQQLAQLMESPHFDQLWLLYLTQVRDEILWHSWFRCFVDERQCLSGPT